MRRLRHTLRGTREKLAEGILLLHHLLLCHLLARPAPFFSQLVVEEADFPAGFLADAVEDLEDFFLLAAVDEDFGGDVEGADGDGGDAAVFDVRDYAADLVRVVELHLVHFGGVAGLERVDLREEGHSCVVEEAADDCCTFDEPGIC